MLPSDIFATIIEFQPYDTSSSVLSTFNPTIKKYRLIILSRYANKIKKWWKYYKPPSDFELVDALTYHESLSQSRHSPILKKKNIIKYMIFHYDKKYLFRYPKFYIRKMGIYNSDLITNQITNYVDNIYYADNIRIKPRAYDVYTFLKMKEVTTSNLSYCGL